MRKQALRLSSTGRKFRVLAPAVATTLGIINSHRSAYAGTTITYGTAGSAYTQNFDGLQQTGNAPTVSGNGPFDLSTTFGNANPETDLNGWYAEKIGGTGANLILRVDTGSLTAGAIYSYGASGSTNRALGSLASGTTIGQFGAVLVNNTGTTLNTVSLSYTGEQWRNGGGTAVGTASNNVGVPNTLSFSYSLGSTTIDSSGGSFISFPSLGFTDTQHNGTVAGAALDGTNPANQVAVNGAINNLTWAPGQSLVIRWQDTNDSGNDDGIAIDNLTFSAISSYVARNLTWTQTSGTWDTAAQNFTTDGVNPTNFNSTDNVEFSTPGNNTVTVATGGVTAGNVRVNAVGTYTFQNTGGDTNGIGGAGFLAKSGSGTLILNSPNTYTGSTFADHGTIEIGNSNQIGAGKLGFSNGTVVFNGASTGTTFTLASLSSGAGAGTIVVNQPAGTSVGSSVTITSASPLARGSTAGTLTFTNTGPGTLGGGGAADPKILFNAAPLLGPAGQGQGIISSSATSCIPYAIVTTTSGGVTSGTFATYVSGVGVAPAVLSARDQNAINGAQGPTSIENTNYVPTANGQINAGNTVAMQSLTINPQAPGLSLDLNGNAIQTAGLILSGGTDFTFTSSSTPGSVMGTVNTSPNNGNGTHTIWVTNPSTTLFVDTPIGASGGDGSSATPSPITFAGPGFVELDGTSDLLNSVSSAGGSATNINLAGGTLVASIGPTGSYQGPQTTLNFRGGVFEVQGGGTFTRSLISTGGGVTWSNITGSASGEGSGGFSARGGTLTVNIGGAATPDQLVWGSGVNTPDAAGNIPSAFLHDGDALMFGSTKSDSTVIWQNAIGLDDGAAGHGPEIREIIVTKGQDNAGPDKTIMNGIISGSASASLVKDGNGTLELGAANTYGGTTTVSAGTLIAGVSGALPGGPVVITDSGTVQLGTSIGGSTISSLAISGNGTLDLNNDHLIINYGAGNPSPVSSIRALLNTGFNGGAWNGPGGIVTSALASNPGYSIGYADSADPGNPAGLASGTLEVAFTLIGDADLNHTVNGIDFGILAANFNKASTAWDQGDFDYNGIVNGIDFTNLAANFNKAANSASDIAALDAFAAANGLLADVPEPATVALLAIGTIGTLARRRRRSPAAWNPTSSAHTER
jgi:autotransporter-associated beta strand protein